MSKSDSNNELVLVTGGSGFIATHCIAQLLDEGYRVRTTVRSVKRQEEVIGMVKAAGEDAGDRLTFVEADLTKDAGWPEAVAGCKYVLHVASPFPPGVPKDENDLIIPAREGALRVLRAARDAGVERVVMTSSFAAIGYGHAPTDKPFTELDWTDPNGPGCTAYVKSKTLAERAAWDFIAKKGGDLELSVVNPVGVFGPLTGPDFSSSIQLVSRLMDGSMPGCPRLSFGIVDARDVASLHLLAMLAPQAKGERFLAACDISMTMLEMAKLIKSRMPEVSRKVPTRQVPDLLVRLMALFDSAVKQVVPELGHVKELSNHKAKSVLGWAPRSSEEAILATAESLVALGLISAPGKGK